MTQSDRQEFSAYVRGDHKTQESYRRYVLGQLGTARARIRLMILEIDSIRQAVESGAIDPDRALGDLAQLGGLAFLQPVEPPFEDWPTRRLVVAAPPDDEHDVEQQNGF